VAWEYVKLATSSINDGQTETVTDTLEEDKHLYAIKVMTDAGGAANASVAEIKIDNEVLTNPDAPCALMAPAIEQPFLIERDLITGQKVRVKITNHEGVADIFWVVLIYKKA